MAKRRSETDDDTLLKFRELALLHLGQDEFPDLKTPWEEMENSVDSLDVTEFVMACEEEFGVTVDDEDLENARCLADVLTAVRKARRATPPKAEQVSA